MSTTKDAYVTWIIPAYNGGRYIHEAIESILKQPCKACKVIVVDDGSTDNTLQIAQSIEDERVSVIHKENGGVSSARNLGISIADTPYIAFLDADDVLCGGAYDDTVLDLLLEGRYDILDFSYYEADQDLKHGIPYTYSVYNLPKGEAYHCNELKEDAYKIHASAFYRSELLKGEKAACFPESIVNNEDIVFRFLAYCYCDLKVNLDRPLYVYRNNINSEQHYNTLHFRLSHCISSWHWCKDRCLTEAQKDRCDRQVAAVTAHYIREACKRGCPADEILSVIESEPVKEALQNRNALWSGSLKTIEEFFDKPDRFRLKLRISSIPERAVKKIIYTPFGRKCYCAWKYREDISKYIIVT